MTGTQSTGNKHMAGLKCLGESWGRPRRKLYHSQQPSNMTGPKPPLWRKWGRKECSLSALWSLKLPHQGPGPQLKGLLFPYSALTGSQWGLYACVQETCRGDRWGPWVSWWPSTRAAECRRWGILGGADADCNLPKPKVKGYEKTQN